MFRIALRVCLILCFQGLSLGSEFPGIAYLFPPPEAVFVAPESQLIVRFTELNPDQVGNLSDCISVSGSQSGKINGSIRIISDARTLTFTPDNPFVKKETVHVIISPESSNIETLEMTVDYAFVVSSAESESGPNKSLPPQKSPNVLPMAKRLAQDPVVLNGVSVPSDFPFIDITINNNPDDGYIFLNNWDNSSPFNVIFDNDGAPFWYRKMPDRRRDFKVQDNGNLSMLVRDASGYEFGQGFIAMDRNYRVVDTYHAVNGYATDEHELQILPDGSYYLIGIRGETVDMSRYVNGGRTDARVNACVIQGFTAKHDLVFQWRAWDHFDIRDSYVPGENELNGRSIRFPHMNAIDIDLDGNILLSSRHLSEITKINRETGEIMWRLGGINNQFRFTNDPLNGPENQHDIRVVGPDRYTIFDNGNEHNPQISRGVEYLLDHTAKTATITWFFRDTPDKYTFFMGNHQVLPNGNHLINWARSGLPKLTEVTPDGQKTFEMDFRRDYNCYRVFRFPWDGMAAEPYLMIEPSMDAVTLLFNKFGDPDVDHYNIYSGHSPNSTQLIATSTESFKHITDVESGRRTYFRVTAVNSEGVESGYSNEESLDVSLVSPGENMVTNGAFEEGFNNWEWLVREADADYEITDAEQLHFVIRDGGNLDWNIQALYPGISLIQGERYLFEFDARADQNRVVWFDVRKNGDPYTNHSKIGATALTRQWTHFAHEFTMEEASELNARIVLNAGADDSDVYVDNVSLKQEAGSTVPQTTEIFDGFQLFQNYPNPFNAGTTIRYAVSEQSRVKITVFNNRGQRADQLYHGQVDTGRHQYRWDAGTFNSGIYVIQVESEGLKSAKKTKISKKTILIK